ncbi:hypothetical protein HPB47_008668 [Ixodes persulcatus]|uniref:Uncharacterized protein n=1 Tax=Ixodes persulcatus TaxID=34615 RepID=A0AC60P456_IXOPE|nr:hypothetical protein HPB47_008668 [Ixodes persulcatus]
MSPSNNSTSAPSGESVSVSEPLDQPADVLDGNFVPPGLLRILGSLSNKLDVPTAEVKCLNVENCRLSSKIQQLPTTAPYPASVPSSRNVPPEAVGRPTPSSVNRELRSPNAALANSENAEDDGFTLTTNQAAAWNRQTEQARCVVPSVATSPENLIVTSVDLLPFFWGLLADAQPRLVYRKQAPRGARADGMSAGQPSFQADTPTHYLEPEHVPSGTRPPPRQAHEIAECSEDDSTFKDDISDMDDSEGSQDWTESRGKKRRRKSGGSGTSGSTSHRQLEEGFTVLFAPIKSDSVASLSSSELTEYVECAAPGAVKEVRVKEARNLFAVEARTPKLKGELLDLKVHCTTPVRAVLPSTPNTCIGLIRDVELSLSDADIRNQIRAPVKIWTCGDSGKSLNS